MALSYKHKFKNINNNIVTVVEENINKERLDFVKDLLEFNNNKTIVEEVKPKEDGGETLYNIYVNDPIFNLIIWIYDRRLKTKDGRYVTHEYWEKQGGKTKPQYWESLYKKD